MLATDRIAPKRYSVSRFSDSRVSQYWDGEHAVARRMAADLDQSVPPPACCEQNGILWDLAAVYPKGAVWEPTIPAPALFDGTVLDIAPRLESSIR